MDSTSLESLSDNSTLPELSFEDLLDQSPIKKLPNSLYENDVLEDGNKTEKDDSLNTPVAKRKLPQRQFEPVQPNQLAASDALEEMLTHTQMKSTNATETSQEQKKKNALGSPTPPTTPKTTQILAAATEAAASVTTTAVESDTNASTSTPVLLNSKIALSKTNITPQTIVKIATTPKIISTMPTTSTALNSATASSTSTLTTAKTTLGTVTTIDGKTALKTANGQIVYIQKGQPKTATIGTSAIIGSGSIGNVPTAVRIKPATAATGTTTNMTTVKVTPMMSASVSGVNTKILTATTAGTANIGGNKTVIQLVRSADGKLIPLKTATAGGKSTLTLSPNIAAQLAGKKLITSGGQVVLKAASTAIATATPLKQAVSTNASATVAESIVSTAKPIKIQKIMTPSSKALATSTTVAAQPITSATITASKLVSTSTSSGVSLATSTSTVVGTSNATTTTTQPIGTTSTAGGKIYVQGTQIVLPSSQLIKLSPKLASNTATAAVAGTSASGSSGNNNTSNSSTPISGALHAIHIPGKPGLQYVRVFTAPKKSASTQSTTATTETTTTATTSSAATAKVLNSMPPKFTVVRPSPTSKIILTKSPKTDGSPVLSPIATSKVKTIVTVPTIRSISSSSDSPSTSSAPVVTTVSLIKSTATSTSNASPTASTNSANIASNSGSIRPKPKISEINSEIQRMTASTGEEKKVVCGPDGKRYLVMPRSMLRTAQTANTQNRLVSGASIQQQQKPPQQQQNSTAIATQQSKVYSVVKTGTNRPTLAAANASEGGMKSFIICKSTQGGSPVKAIQVKRPVQQMAESQSQSQPRAPVQQKDEEDERKIPSIASKTAQSNNKFVPIKIKQEPLDNDDLTSLMFSDEAMVRGGVRRKHCNCSKSQCLKLYCDCFANGEFCQDCTCKDCFNNLQYEDERQRAIKSCLERNPSAFKPKITTSSDQNDTRLHNKGCNCKRSGCLKNYCECFEAKIPCSSNCKCVGCRNVEDRPDLDMDPIDPKLLESIANASNATNTIARAVSTSNQSSFGGGIRRTYEKAFAKKERKSESDNLDENEQRIGRKRANLEDDFTGSAALLASPQLGEGADDDANAAADKRSSNFITQEVIDATIQCMISQADECLKNSLPTNQIEKMVLEELGRCLVEIIDFSIRNTDTSFSQN